MIVTPPMQRTVLVVDDEILVTTLLSEILERSGLKVVTASSGNEGINSFFEYRDELLCVILDLSMPDMLGTDVFAAISQSRKDLPVIFSTGYTEDSLNETLLKNKTVSVIHKPFSPDEITQKVFSAVSAQES